MALQRLESVVTLERAHLRPAVPATRERNDS
jgi:hypothetical protein